MDVAYRVWFRQKGRRTRPFSGRDSEPRAPTTPAGSARQPTAQFWRSGGCPDDWQDCSKRTPDPGWRQFAWTEWPLPRQATIGTPEPQPPRRGRPGRQATDLHEYDGAAHDRSRLAGATAWVSLLLGVQSRPGAHPHRPVLLVLGDVRGGRYGPGRRLLADEFGPVLARTTALGEGIVSGGSARQRTSTATGTSSNPCVTWSASFSLRICRAAHHDWSPAQLASVSAQAPNLALDRPPQRRGYLKLCTDHDNLLLDAQALAGQIKVGPAQSEELAPA